MKIGFISIHHGLESLSEFANVVLSFVFAGRRKCGIKEEWKPAKQ